MQTPLSRASSCVPPTCYMRRDPVSVLFLLCVCVYCMYVRQVDALDAAVSNSLDHWEPLQRAYKGLRERLSEQALRHEGMLQVCVIAGAPMRLNSESSSVPPSAGNSGVLCLLGRDGEMGQACTTRVQIDIASCFC